MLICTCTDSCNYNQLITPDSFAKEAACCFSKSIGNSGLKNSIMEYKHEFKPCLTSKGDKLFLYLSVCTPFQAYDLTHSIDCISSNIIVPAMNSLTEKIFSELLKYYQSVNNGKEKYIKSKKISLVFYPLELASTLTWAARVANENISLLVQKEYDINNSVEGAKISTYIKVESI